MFSSTPFFKTKPKSKEVTLTLTYEDTELWVILALKKLQGDLGKHISLRAFTMGKISFLYSCYEKYPKTFFFLKNRKHELSCLLEYEDFGVDNRAERPENVVYLGINLSAIREGSDKQ